MATKEKHPLFGTALKVNCNVAAANPPHADTPDLVSEYVFREELVNKVLIWLYKDDVCKNLYLTGPTGTGKTSLIEQVAARLGRGVLKVSCGPHTEEADLRGRYVLNAFGGMDFAYGPAVRAMREGLILLLDEIDLLHPGVAASLNPILDSGKLYIPDTREVIKAHPEFRIAVTGNTTGGGDETGNYTGTRRQNLAWRDRYMFVQVPYMEEAQEIALLASILPEGFPPKIAESMVKVANDVRNLFIGLGDTGEEEIDLVISTRSLMRWARLIIEMRSMVKKSPVLEALDYALLDGASPRVQAAVTAIVQRIFPADLLDPTQHRKAKGQATGVPF